MLSCKEVSRLVASDESLSFLKRMELHMHFALCKHCSNYRKQLRNIRKGYRKLFHAKAESNKAVAKKLKQEVLREIEKV